MAESVIYKGERFRIQTSGRYYQSGRKDSVERLLHRRVWRDKNGPIPQGMVIHHKDGDWRNNKLSNLECLPKGKHSSQHMREIYARNPKFAAHGLEKAREAAKAWHASKEGLAWHSKNGKAAWIGRKRDKQIVCAECGTKKMLFFKKKNNYCSTACSLRFRFRSYFTDKRNCAWCGAEFMANRHRDTMCCSRACNNRKRGALVRKGTP